VEANSTGGQGSRRAVAPNDDDDDDDDDDDIHSTGYFKHTYLDYGTCWLF
jgi:hypothetical protein